MPCTRAFWIVALLLLSAPALAQTEGTRHAVLAGGCFWSMQPPFDALEGVLGTELGYTGGHTPDPAYWEVTTGRTGHVEAVRIHYDPQRITYDEILNTFWRSIDPLDAHGQFCDRGPHYHTAIFVQDARQRAIAEASRTELDRSGRFDRPVITPVRDAAPFYRAEDTHQDYYRKHPERYADYVVGCGRQERLLDLWGHLAPEETALRP
ncbi:MULTISPECIES: peptide-methionine (S)-S-oxide reductase MsrA [unclassified Thioalkalivibrio]|uniref:peptide-methionine (S)-S-oxide reductase MsrA n=1 Tax=unclassified Thioalkalivibrio TaxID=2621013 RepID=UPI0003698496|nr:MULTISPECIES: peptide-methionine (S)-S-oxide reductase MsrA [unclassified Thioalkalivibrio]